MHQIGEETILKVNSESQLKAPSEIKKQITDR